MIPIVGYDRRMRLLLSTSWLVLLYAAQASALAAESGVDLDTRRMAVLIKQLGDAQFAARESAVRELVDFGERALPAMRLAASSTRDLEVRFRANQVIREILADCRKSKSLGLEMAVIDAGRFVMGSPLKEAGRRDDEFRHRVEISRPFLLGAYEVTQGQFQELMNVAPSHFQQDAEGKDKVANLDTSQFPVERVTWFDAVVFCNQLSKRDGYATYYKTADVQLSGTSISHAEISIAGGNGYRLPTEAEWEYACRAATRGPFHFGSGTNGREANLQPRPTTVYGSKVKRKSLERTEKVGSYEPNAWGLYDMHGNVAEWCWDWYDKNTYTDARREDPQGPDFGDHRVLRGGSWLVSESNCRSASRFYQAPGERKYFAGFRVARTP